MITHVVFDFDGTLANSLHVSIQIYNDIAEKHRYARLTADQLEAFRKLSLRERCNQLGVPFYKLPGLFVQVVRGFRQAMTSIAFNEGIPELLKELKSRGLKLVILSSNDEENIRTFLRHHSAEQWVDDIYCSTSLFGKARLLRALMKRHKLKPDQLVYVGDEHRDVEACKEVDVKVIAVRWGADAEARLREAGPNHIVERPAEIAECVGRWS